MARKTKKRNKAGTRKPDACKHGREKAGARRHFDPSCSFASPERRRGRCAPGANTLKEVPGSTALSPARLRPRAPKHLPISFSRVRCSFRRFDVPSATLTSKHPSAAAKTRRHSGCVPTPAPCIIWGKPKSRGKMAQECESSTSTPLDGGLARAVQTDPFRPDNARSSTIARQTPWRDAS